MRTLNGENIVCNKDKNINKNRDSKTDVVTDTETDIERIFYLKYSCINISITL